MPDEDVDRLESLYSGFIDAQIALAQGWCEARLRKRYAIPFVAPIPEIFLGWVVALVTLAAYQRRGWNPSSAENELIRSAATDARLEVKEAADSKDGLYDLPLRQDSTESGVSKGTPLGYSEADPYSWMDVQRDTVRNG